MSEKSECFFSLHWTLYSNSLKKEVNDTFCLCASTLDIFSMSIATRGNHYTRRLKRGRWHNMNDTRFPTAPRILGSLHYIGYNRTNHRKCGLHIARCVLTKQQDNRFYVLVNKTCFIMHWYNLYGIGLLSNLNFTSVSVKNIFSSFLGETNCELSRIIDILRV